MPPPQQTGWSGFVHWVFSVQVSPQVQMIPPPGPPHAHAYPGGQAAGSLGLSVQSTLPPVVVDAVVPAFVVEDDDDDDEVIMDADVVLAVEVPEDDVVLVAPGDPPEPPAPPSSSPQPATGSRTKSEAPRIPEAKRMVRAYPSG
jgi:hypothetical protein